MSERKPNGNNVTPFQTRDLIVMHLREAARLGVAMEEGIDIQLFRHLISMCIYAAREGQQEEDYITFSDKRLHS